MNQTLAREVMLFQEWRQTLLPAPETADQAPADQAPAAYAPAASEAGAGEYPRWAALLAAAQAVVGQAPAHWEAADVARICYVLALDHEGEELAACLVGVPACLLALAPHALTYPDHHARWQVASCLGELGPAEAPAAEALLLRFAADEQEYVRRRALLALVERNSPHAERLALAAWETGHEYQRLAALHALAHGRSAHLPHYLRRAQQERSSLVRLKAAQIAADATL